MSEQPAARCTFNDYHTETCKMIKLCVWYKGAFLQLWYWSICSFSCKITLCTWRELPLSVCFRLKSLLQIFLDFKTEKSMFSSQDLIVQLPFQDLQTKIWPHSKNLGKKKRFDAINPRMFWIVLIFPSRKWPGLAPSD